MAHSALPARLEHRDAARKAPFHFDLDRGVVANAASTSASEGAQVLRHEALVRRVAATLYRNLPDGLDPEDLVQAGMIDLLEAIRGYDGDRGTPFASYAGLRIHGAMMDEIRRVLWAPRSVFHKARQVNQAVQKMQNESGRRVTTRELAGHLGLGVDECATLVTQAQARTVTAVDPAQVAEPEDPSEGPFDHLQRERFAEHLADAAAALPSRERRILHLYYVRELKLREIGELLGLTESRVCQLHKQAVAGLRRRLAETNDGMPPLN